MGEISELPAVTMKVHWNWSRRNSFKLWMEWLESIFKLAMEKGTWFIKLLPYLSKAFSTHILR
jgi:hypothetical protein